MPVKVLCTKVAEDWNVLTPPPCDEASLSSTSMFVKVFALLDPVM